jgi:hypothetical protein
MYFRSHRLILLAALIFVACGTSQRELNDLRNTARTAILRGELPAARAAIDRGLAATAAGDKAEQAWAFRLLDAETATGLKLTESYAMWPAAAVSGFYFSHPESRYFGVGKIGRDQAADYAARKGWSLEQAERWLAPILNYDPKLIAEAAA